MRRIWFGRFLAGLAAFSVPVFAQSTIASASSSSNGNVVRGTMGFSGRPMVHGAPVAGAPYSAQRVSEHLQIGSDGTRFTTNNQQETIYRDSQGRIRTERPMMVGPNPQAAGAPVVVEIQDRVAGFAYTLDTQNKIAHRVAYSASPNQPLGGGGVAAARSGQWFSSTNGTAAAIVIATAPPPAGSSPATLTSAPTLGPHPAAPALAGSSPPHPEISNEDLGTQVIEGVAAEGHRAVQTWPAGAVGNDRPFQVVSEYWYSPEIKETVLSKSTDPRSGENTTKLINISRGEPDASLFLPPADYSVVDETGPFQIQWTTEAKQ